MSQQASTARAPRPRAPPLSPPILIDKVEIDYPPNGTAVIRRSKVLQ